MSSVQPNESGIFAEQAERRRLATVGSGQRPHARGVDGRAQEA
ncbi:MAG: hypothetical protein ACLP01_03725 [Solirubrobacteraceae bacterium]